MKSSTLFAALAFTVGAAFSQLNDEGYYLMRFKNEDEAIEDHMRMLDLLGISSTSYRRGDNPITLSYYKLVDNRVIASTVFTSSGYYDVLFMELDDTDVIKDEQLIYIRR